MCHRVSFPFWVFITFPCIGKQQDVYWPIHLFSLLLHVIQLCSIPCSLIIQLYKEVNLQSIVSARCPQPPYKTQLDTKGHHDFICQSSNTLNTSQSTRGRSEYDSPLPLLLKKDLVPHSISGWEDTILRLRKKGSCYYVFAVWIMYIKGINYIHFTKSNIKTVFLDLITVLCWQSQ